MKSRRQNNYSEFIKNISIKCEKKLIIEMISFINKKELGLFNEYILRYFLC